MVYWLEVKTMMLFQLTGKITDVFVSCKAVSKRKIAGDSCIKKKNNTQCLLFSLCQQGQSHFVMTVFCNTIRYVDIAKDCLFNHYGSCDHGLKKLSVLPLAPLFITSQPVRLQEKCFNFDQRF